MKNLLIFLSVVAVAICVTLSVNYYKRADHAQGVLDEERYARLTAEESLKKAEAKVVSIETEFDRTQKKLQAFEKSIDQEKSINESLKSRLDEMQKKNGVLTAQLQECEARKPAVVPLPSDAGPAVN